MTPINLTFAELDRLVKIALAIALAAAGALLFFKWPDVQAEPVKVLFQTALTALGVPSVFLFGISRLRWTRPWLAKLFGRRMVHGLWWGTLTSDFTDKETGAVVPPLDIAFVVRQGYFFVSINSYTRGQPAKSSLESLTVDAKSETAQLQYVFEMRRHRFGENKITFGFGDLTLSADDKRLSGTYWTNSPTQGELSLELLTRECDGIHAFADAETAKQKLSLH